MDGDEPTQATQNVLDPRRIGKQNSGFSDEDVSDIICVLYPHSESAREEVQRLAKEDSPYIIGKNEADDVEPDYELEDHASRFESHPVSHGNYAIILRLSSPVKSPSSGFAFGRNSARCDVVFVNDPLRRISNVHFRIYVNEYGSVMIEDQSTNGTFVDRQLLTRHPKDKSAPANKWVLGSGNLIRIVLHSETLDLTFRVRIPRRDDDYDRAYLNKVNEYFIHHGLHPASGEIPGINSNTKTNPGPVDLFKAPGGPQANRVAFEASPSPRLSPKRKDSHGVIRNEWKGSGKYNRIGMIGKGAFAVVYKVTSKYDGLPYAAKELEKRRFIKNGVLDQKVENEMKIMQRVNHPNIVRYIENFDWEDRLLIIIMEYIPHGDLGKTISDLGAFTVETTQTMSKQLLSALGYLHANNITHRDVKPDNILIQSMDPLVVKLTDFGLSKMVDTAETFLRTFCGTLLYCAPEVYTEYAEYDDNGVRSRGKKMRRVPGQRYNHAVDIWSLGGVLFYSLTGAPPYPVKSGISYSELLHKIMTTNLDTLPLQRFAVSGAGIDFIQRMLQRRPENRSTIIELESHPWLCGFGTTVQASQSYDEITDDEEYPSQLEQLVAYDNDRVSDSMSDISDKENGYMDHGAQPRLFGEVGVSAIGSSGVIPEDYPNLPDQNSMGATDILDSHEDEAYDSGDSDTIKAKTRRAYQHNTTSIYPNQSADQLQSLVENVASQSLGGNASVIQEPGASQRLSFAVDPNSSKRKPPSPGTSEEYDENTPPGKPIIKRLKSEGSPEDQSPEMLEEYRLLVRMPQVTRLNSGRQIDYPVSKMVWWQQDRKTWHLRYPEMTQRQHDAFRQAAKEGGEEFGPGKTALWDLAMKYFAPEPRPEGRNGQSAISLPVGLRREDSRMVDDPVEFPPTAAPIESSSIPDTCPPDTKIVVPVQESLLTNRALALVDTDASSCVQGITFPITDSLVSFGRGPDNTESFKEKQEPRVPKYAFKIMLWKDGFDPSRHSTAGDQPWCKEASQEDAQYHFWISTKATLGLKINGYNLASSDPKNPGGPSQYWAKIYNGDSLMIWGGQDPRNQTRLTFRCFWGGSSITRPVERQQLELASPQVAAKLDAVCQRTEKRVRDATERKRKSDEASADIAERSRQVDRERERSRLFEQKRLEAVEFWAARPALSRKGSPATGPASTSTRIY
ncbi:serine/threonine protein kinase domain protein [Metarhizium robertsii]|uniref:non-specific serine/threonine protein kinase n=2 Tax=Metarhizium robertsii TaxID=568076 RepID=E9EW70_METRA|nr:Serine/threonine-protein kinase, active site protein [Metarhizium robertsii ARSEF 23]EFZ00492.1 Serine/threonine-protein kinase, active site protein [Metarhizium robertsii ARSEF 23]EXV02978.1 serine/threonine protein kinase domain protein [Metarhizium robertsii]